MSNRHGLTDAQCLTALFNASRQQGMGFLDASGSKPMTLEDAQQIINGRKGKGLYFDYLRGRVMKVDISEPTIDMRLFDRDNGQGAGADALLEYATRPQEKK